MASNAGTALKKSVLHPAVKGDHDTLRAITASGDGKRPFRTVAKACTGPIIILLVVAALGPAKWVPRTELGWQFDHIIGYFGITLFFCFAWPRPFLIGGIFMALAALLEGLQAFTPDRTAYLPAIFYGAGGALAAALTAELFIRAARRYPQATVHPHSIALRQHLEAFPGQRQSHEDRYTDTDCALTGPQSWPPSRREPAAGSIRV